MLTLLRIWYASKRLVIVAWNNIAYRHVDNIIRVAFMAVKLQYMVELETRTMYARYCPDSPISLIAIRRGFQ
jgi:hypothetical protein